MRESLRARSEALAGSRRVAPRAALDNISWRFIARGRDWAALSVRVRVRRCSLRREPWRGWAILLGCCLGVPSPLVGEDREGGNFRK
jgi:hypothetical protein